jgi:hypothetical protein
MSAIESSVLMFTNIVTLAESNIAKYFTKVDESEDRSQLDTLSIAALAEHIGTELGIKQQECLYSICLYLKNRPELEIRAGKNGGICRVGDNRSKTIMTPKECALKNYDAVKTCAFTVIDEEFDKAQSIAEKQNLTGKIRLNFQDLSQIIADKLKIKQYASYHCLKSYIQDERADLMIELGRHGGLVRK